MLRRNRMHPVTMVGLVLLVVANLANHFLQPGPWLSADALDGLRGLLMGIAIGTLLLGVWRQGREARCGEA